ncbi:MAG TPA: 1,4-alpha-glucan branching protein GlgB [Steroidobacteraceae bacterium]|jgi:1,4-alpha-glucan branching enzyme|nr:1,4-alpha-glucan branching protein GlgB [Steroidobacteraceae bacterium]
MPQGLSKDQIASLLAATTREPRSLLGYHEFARENELPIALVRVLERDAVSVSVFFEDESIDSAIPLTQLDPAGLFEGRIPYRRPLQPYRLHIRYRDGGEVTKHDPYYFAPQLSDFDLYLFGEGNHHTIYRKLGAHPAVIDGVSGVHFAVWAPTAQRVSVVGDFNFWDGRRHVLHARGSGVWELFVPGIGVGALYKFEIRSEQQWVLKKSDPYGLQMQMRPDTASVVANLDDYQWNDQKWIANRKAWDPQTAPVTVYEVHPASWRRHPDGSFYTWHQLVEHLIPYVLEMGYTHIELMGVAEYPFDGSWGYQVTGYYAPTARYGSPNDFKHFIDCCHQAGIGVIMDWVPGHFPKDEHGLREFDGTALYEHADPRQGEHQEWGTKVFNYGRNEVRNFLVANALYWIEQFHIDGLRVDAVASMLYLDYARKHGEWIPNRYGGRENIDAIEFLKQLNWSVGHYFPGVLMIAEESTAFPGVTQPVHLGGLGFTFKWNMGWMNDTLRYMQLDPLYRRYEHNLITFSMMYAWSEKFMLPLSHDEVVHGKRALLDKMPGDEWQKRANLRVLLGYMTVHPGKKLLFMGSEFGQWHEWRDHEELDWPLLEHPNHRGLREWCKTMNFVYRERPELHASDHLWEGFQWVDLSNHDDSVFAFIRRASHDSEPLLCVFNCTPVPRNSYLLGAPLPGRYRKVLDSDDPAWGGSGYSHQYTVDAEHDGWGGFPHRLRLDLPPLAVTFWQRG